MPLSPQTTQRLKSLQKRAEEMMQAFGVPRDEAWSMMATDAAQRAAAVAEEIDRFQQTQAQAELRSLSARAATYKSNMEGK